MATFKQIICRPHFRTRTDSALRNLNSRLSNLENGFSSFLNEIDNPSSVNMNEVMDDERQFAFAFSFLDQINNVNRPLTTLEEGSLDEQSSSIGCEPLFIHNSGQQFNNVIPHETLDVGNTRLYLLDESFVSQGDQIRIQLSCEQGSDVYNFLNGTNFRTYGMDGGLSIIQLILNQ